MSFERHYKLSLEFGQREAALGTLYQMDFSVFSSNSLEYIFLSLICLIAVWKDSVVRVISPHFKSDSQGKGP